LVRSMGKRNELMKYHGIEFERDKIAAFCRRNRINRLSLFGSILREDFGPDSDIDLLVEFAPDARVSLFELGGDADRAVGDARPPGRPQDAGFHRRPDPEARPQGVGGPACRVTTSRARARSAAATMWATGSDSSICSLPLVTPSDLPPAGP